MDGKIVREARNSVYLYISSSGKKSRRSLDGRAVQDVVVVGAIEQVYRRSESCRVLLVGLFREAVAVNLAAWAAVQVCNLQNEVDWLEQQVGQANDAQVLNLTVDNVNCLRAVRRNSSMVGNEGVVDGCVSFEIGGGQHAEVVDYVCLDGGVVETLQQDHSSQARVCDVGSNISQQAVGLFGKVFVVFVAANVGEHGAEAHETGHLAFDPGLVSEVDELLVVGECDCWRNLSLAGYERRAGQTRLTAPSTVSIALDLAIVGVGLGQSL